MMARRIVRASLKPTAWLWRRKAGRIQGAQAACGGRADAVDDGLVRGTEDGQAPTERTAAVASEIMLGFVPCGWLENGPAEQ
jgi:hypothetical protein